MITKEQYDKLKNQLKKLEEEKQRSEGALSQILQQLDEEFGVKTLAQGERKLKRLQAKAKQEQKKFDQAMKDFEKAFPQ